MARQARAKAAAKTLQMPEDIREDVATVRPKSLVFISHDSRDADLAEAFGNLLSDISGGTLKSFRSSDKRGANGIEFGAEWYAAIMSQIDEATDVVALLTPQSLDRPWILYEAGVAKGKLETTVFGVALGVPLDRVSTGPFGQFQNCDDDEDSLTKLMMQLLQRNPDAAPREQAVRTQVKIFREAVATILKSRGEVAKSPPSDEQNAAKLFEEVKAMVRELPERMEISRPGSSRKRSRRRMFHLPSMMFDELLSQQRRPPNEGGAALAWLLTISAFKEDAPWAFDLGQELYRALKAGNAATIKRELELYEEFLVTVSRSSAIREMFAYDDESYDLIYQIPEILGQTIHHLKAIYKAGGLTKRSLKTSPMRITAV
ncbi:MAG: hypothetical protein JWP49_1570 [Phenylobacterium sp.]|nr:hypothetical protein [Phenylobacterium sp.]